MGGSEEVFLYEPLQVLEFSNFSASVFLEANNCSVGAAVRCHMAGLDPIPQRTVQGPEVGQSTVSIPAHGTGWSQGPVPFPARGSRMSNAE
jgi:hypothetical protein